jgi:hypothetical protein
VICNGFSVAEQENTRPEPRPFPPNKITREIHVAAHRGSREASMKLLGAGLRPDGNVTTNNVTSL